VHAFDGWRRVHHLWHARPPHAHNAVIIDSMHRLLLTHAPAAAAWSAFAAPVATHSAEAGVGESVSAADDGFITFADKNEKFKALFRLERDLRDEGITFSTY